MISKLNMKKLYLITLLCLFAAAVSVPFSSAVPTKYEPQMPERLVEDYLSKSKKKSEKESKKSEKKSEKESKKKPEKESKKSVKAPKKSEKESKKSEKAPKKSVKKSKKESKKSYVTIGDPTPPPSGGSPVADSGATVALLGLGALCLFSARRFANKLKK